MKKIQDQQSVVLCGFMACGKTTLGRQLAARLGYAFADTDEMLFERTQMTLAQIFEAGGEAYFRELEHETIQAASLLTRTVISTGGGVMTFERNARLLAERTLIVHIQRDFDACYPIIQKRQNRPIAGQRSEAQMRQLYQSRQAAYSRYADFTLHNNGSPEEALDALISALRG